jgi:transglutaminase-like putative cysteine protease
MLRRKHLGYVLASLLTALPLLASPALDEAAKLSDKGEFKQAANVLTTALKDKSLAADDRKQLEWERDRLARIRNDYSLTADALYAKLADSVKNLKRSEFEKWLADGWFDGRVIDGTTYYVGTSISNLFYRHPELNPRRTPPKDGSKEQHERLRIAREIVAATKKENTPYVLPKRLKATMTVSVAAEAVPAGETIRAWLPVPRHNEFQDGIKVVSSSSPIKKLAPENSPIRSAYMEQKAVKGKKTKFVVSFEYTIHGVHFDLDPKKVQPIDASQSDLKHFLSEAPHVVFSDKIKGLVHELAGSETNPVLNAKAFYNWIAANIQYSYAREYSTLTNLSDYCFANRYGDCGQEAMLFITMCRAQGIPARWQTGWDVFPGSHDIHDWTEIYIAPYGWVPVDAWAGIYTHRYCTSLTQAERDELQNFYFGGLEGWRMVANSDHSQKLDPPKKTMRSDDIDFQRGEVEWRRGNIYFNKYSYHFDIEELKH